MTNVGKGGGDVGQAGANPRLKRKREKTRAEKAESKEEHSPVLPIVEAAYESQRRLHAYREDDSMRSLWSRFFSFATLADEVCRFPEDSKMIEEVGRAGMSRFLQVIGARLVAIGRVQELAVESEVKDSVEISELSTAVQEKEKMITELSSSLKGKEEELAEEKRLHSSVLEGNKTLTSENDRLMARVKELENEIYEAFAQGFERATDQVRVLFPEVDAAKLDATKIIVDGELIDDEVGKQSDSSSIGDKIE
ncbi:hypothetical protein S245_018603 [Arachis hypogaea]